MSIFEHLTSLFAPDDCLNCGREGWLLCDDCRPLLPKVVGRCFGCQQQIVGVACKVCMRSAGVASLSAATHYSGNSKLLIACLKFRGNQSAARIMADAIYARCYLPPGSLLIHMPATTGHVRERGYDQAQLIARHISRVTGLPRLDALRRYGQQHQLGSDRDQRLNQLTTALTATHLKQLQGRHIILIDDVLTTGSSITAAADILRQAGAAKIEAVVFAQSINMVA